MKVLIHDMFAVGYLLTILTGGVIIGMIANSMIASEYMLMTGVISFSLATTSFIRSF